MASHQLKTQFKKTVLPRNVSGCFKNQVANNKKIVLPN
ncbi:hypothetical protein ACVW2L_000809 [Mucilaginibacter sp. HD30]